MQTLAAVLLFLSSILAQTAPTFSAGAIAGAPLLRALDSTTSPRAADCSVVCNVFYSVPATKRFSFGGAVEVRLWRLGVEADVLYTRLTFSSVSVLASPSSGVTFAYSKTTAGRWEIPLLAKYRFGRGAARPFLLAGPAFDWAGGVHDDADIGGRDLSGHVYFEHRASGDQGQLTHGPRGGIAIGGGMELRVGRLRLSPQLRYTRWVRGEFASEPEIRSNSSEAVGLMGFMF